MSTIESTLDDINNTDEYDPSASVQPTLAKFAAVAGSQQIYLVPDFRLECGRVLYDVPIAYKTWGKLNDKRDNVMIICHAFTGSADVEDW